MTGQIFILLLSQHPHTRPLTVCPLPHLSPLLSLCVGTSLHLISQGEWSCHIVSYLWPHPPIGRSSQVTPTVPHLHIERGGL